MTTTSPPSAGSCPDWVEDVPPARVDEFKQRLAFVYQRMLSSATVDPEFVRETITLFWHGSLFADFVPLDYYAGNFRQPDPARPCLAQNVAVGPIPGSNFRLVVSDMAQLFAEAQQTLRALETDWPYLSPEDRAVAIALVTGDLVGGFIRIHPFLNGNGRTSRLLWRWVLWRFGVPPQFTVFPRPSPPYGPLMAEAMRGNNLPLQYHVLQHLSAYSPKHPTALAPPADST